MKPYLNVRVNTFNVLPFKLLSFLAKKEVYLGGYVMPSIFGSQRTQKIEVIGRMVSRFSAMIGLGGMHERFTKGEVLWYMGTMFCCGFGLGAISILLLMMATL